METNSYIREILRISRASRVSCVAHMIKRAPRKYKAIARAWVWGQLHICMHEYYMWCVCADEAARAPAPAKFTALVIRSQELWHWAARAAIFARSFVCTDWGLGYVYVDDTSPTFARVCYHHITAQLCGAGWFANFDESTTMSHVCLSACICTSMLKILTNYVVLLVTQISYLRFLQLWVAQSHWIVCWAYLWRDDHVLLPFCCYFYTL